MDSPHDVESVHRDSSRRSATPWLFVLLLLLSPGGIAILDFAIDKAAWY